MEIDSYWRTRTIAEARDQAREEGSATAFIGVPDVVVPPPVRVKGGRASRGVGKAV